ncbi:MAG: biotin/lipoyl-containing protein, partial [Bryobacteraceae bacterium]
MKLRIEIDGETYFLELQADGERIAYSSDPSLSSSGSASIAAPMPGVFSVLVGDRSFLVSVGPGGAGGGAELEVWTSGERCHAISVGDLRDRSSRRAKASGHGPVEVRAQMPGKVIKVLVVSGATVEAGQGLVVVEAMKMQNEMKAPKGGRV